MDSSAIQFFNNIISVVDLYVDQASFYCSAAELFEKRKKKSVQRRKDQRLVQVGHKETLRGCKVAGFSAKCRLLHTLLCSLYVH